MITIAIPYLHSEIVWDELRFTVRAICRNFTDEFEIVLVGDKHPGLNIPVVVCERVKGREYAKAADSFSKINCMLASDKISDPFLYWYDDVLPLKPVGIEFFKQQYCLHDFAAVHIDRGNHYKDLKYHTYRYMLHKKLPTYCFETHLPRVFNKWCMRQVLERCRKAGDMLLINSLYENTFLNGRPVQLRKDDGIKAGFYGSDGPYSFSSKTGLDDTLKSKTFLNYNNDGLSEALKKYIIREFKDKCRYER